MRPSPEAVALAKAYYTQPKTTGEMQDKYFSMKAHCNKGEEPGIAAIRILAAECAALEDMACHHKCGCGHPHCNDKIHQ